MKNHFEPFVVAAPPATPALLLTHVTATANARDIFIKGSLEPTQCPTLNYPLLYFFYGRAEYRSGGKQAANLPGEKPICFVLETVDDSSIFSVFPFDTGAFELENGIKKRFFPHIKDVLSLSIGQSIKGVQCLVTRFYGTNESFLDFQPTRPDFDPFMDLEASAYFQLISAHGMDDLDGRCTTPEVAVHIAVPLKKVKYVIAPADAEDSVSFLGFCSTYGITPIYYKVKSPLKPNEYISVIQDRLRDLM